MTADTERTYSKTEIREERRELSQLLALQQRKLDALAKMDEAADELEQVEREMVALARRGTQSEQVAAAAPEPQTTGERAIAILRENYPDTEVDARGVLGTGVMRGWFEDSNLVLQSLRHSLRRLADRYEHIERRTDGGKHFYKYVTSLDTDMRIAIAPVNGVAHPALPGGRADG